MIKKISDTSNLVIDTALTTRIGKAENNIRDVSGLVTNTTLNTDTDSGEVKKKFLIILYIILLLIIMNLLAQYLIQK